jgi:hypothetical protein
MYRCKKIKMPCIYCKTLKSPNSSTHTLSRCVESASEIIGPILSLVREHTHDILKQSIELSGYSKGQLAMACKQFNTYFSGSKSFLICAIIKNFFLPQVVRYVSTISLRNLRIFSASYDEIVAGEPSELRTSLIEIMDVLYAPLFGSGRYQYSYNRIINPATREQFSHLKKLSIQISVVQVENKECDICCDSKYHTAKMGCSHEFCVGCVNKLCSSRTKTFISCPMCRSEISNIQVSNEEIKNCLNSRILRC